jgi:hypothetical protein
VQLSVPTGRVVHFPVAPAGALALVLGVTLAANLRFLTTGFAATDSLPLVETSRLANLDSVVRLFTTPVMAGTAFALGEAVYRPFVSLTFGLDYLVWGPDSLGYHMTNLVLHLVTVCAVWLLLRQLGLAVWSSALGALLFAVHPIVMATVPVIGRRDSILPVTAVAAAAVLLLAALDARGVRRSALLIISLGLACIALLSKESAFAAIAMLPILVAGRAYSRGRGPAESVRGARVTVPFIVVAALLFSLRLAVLGGLGGKSEVNLSSLDFDRYGQLIGSFFRELLWAWAGFAPSPREIWLRVAALTVVWLGLTLVWLPRHAAVLAAVGAIWIAGFAVFIAVFQIATLGWLAYFSLIGVALLLAAGLEGAVDQLHTFFKAIDHVARLQQAMRGGSAVSKVASVAVPLRRAVSTVISVKVPLRNAASTVASVVLLIGLVVFSVASIRSSALFRDYPQWQLAGDVEGRYVEALTACVAAAPDATYVSLQRVPGDFDDGQPETGMLGVTLIAQYTAESALRLAFPARPLHVHVGSVDTLRSGADALRFSCARLPNGVELDTQYSQRPNL